jgi:CRP/FNR family transcriptional regulator, nitrogen fixation regulation protein
MRHGINAVRLANSKRKRSLARPHAATLSKTGQNPIDWMASERLLSRGEAIFRRGQSAKYIYKLAYGCVRTFITHGDGRRLITAFYFPGDYFPLEMRATHKGSAEAVTPSMVLEIGTKELTARAATDYGLAKRMLHITSVELQRTQSHSLLLRDGADERVANFLFEMKKRNRRQEVDLLMSRQDIADHLNLTIETVSRALARLEKSSVISFLTHRRVAVHIRRPLAA